ncbi:MAG: hypothetical protein CMO74_00915 [Verrucomicrobiales bacterium]|nr:hypothetical protein [Verrucomicrobiales bacterium]|tara:strand:+ start:1455 stop:2591 length:1137 start_codon:yes stop_codon:yes gene_type:complete
MKILKGMLAGVLLLAGNGVASAPWTVKIKSEDKVYTFGGPLLEKEKTLVGYWSGTNTDKAGQFKWEILRRANHTYTLDMTWIEEGERRKFFGHGLWQVKGGKYRFADLTDSEMEQDEAWPIDVKHRISAEDLWVVEEDVKFAGPDKLVTVSEGEEEGEMITNTEVRVKQFQRLFMRRFNQPNGKREELILDQIRRASIDDFADLPGYFTGLLTDEEKKLVGRWKGSNNDPDDPGEWEMIRRPDHTGTIVFISGEDDEGELKAAHGFWKVRAGRFIFCDLTEGDKILPWDEIFLGDETVVQIAEDKIITQWFDSERRVLGGLFPMRVRNTELPVDEFKFPAMKPYSKEDPFDAAAFLKRIQAAKRKREPRVVEESATNP